jgi:hypothetical protein
VLAAICSAADTMNGSLLNKKCRMSVLSSGGIQENV